jgi:rhodanese-related sulfurtransferase
MNSWKLWIAALSDALLDVGNHARCEGACQHGDVNVSEFEVREIDVVDVPSSFGDADVLLDVREDDEWARGHVAGAQHIPLGDVAARMGELDHDATLYVMCHAGGRSMRAAQYLARNGFEPINVSGGMLAWAGAGRPVVTDDGGVGTV